MTDGECVNMRYACKKMSAHALKLMHAEALKSQIVMWKCLQNLWCFRIPVTTLKWQGNLSNK